MDNVFITITQKAIPLRCQRCHHKWYYKRNNKYVANCPHSRTYVTIKKSGILLIGKEAKPKQSEASVTITSKEDARNHG